MLIVECASDWFDELQMTIEIYSGNPDYYSDHSYESRLSRTQSISEFDDLHERLFGNSGSKRTNF